MSPGSVRSGRGGGDGTSMEWRASITSGQSVRAQLGMEGGARIKGASKRIKMGMWSEPREGRGSDHSAKWRARTGHAKARSKTPGLSTGKLKKRVQSRSMLRSKYRSSVALSK